MFVCILWTLKDVLHRFFKLCIMSIPWCLLVTGLFVACWQRCYSGLYFINDDNKSNLGPMPMSLKLRVSERIFFHLNLNFSSSSGSSKLKSEQQTFQTGCKNYRKSAVHTHNSSIPHKNAVTTDNDLKNPADAPAVKSVLSLNEKQRKDMEIKFLNACQTPVTILRFCVAE